MSESWAASGAPGGGPGAAATPGEEVEVVEDGRREGEVDPRTGGPEIERVTSGGTRGPQGENPVEGTRQTGAVKGGIQMVPMDTSPGGECGAVYNGFHRGPKPATAE